MTPFDPHSRRLQATDFLDNLHVVLYWESDFNILMFKNKYEK